MVSNPHRTDVGFGCENALHWHRLFILSRARLDCCTHLRQVEMGPFGRGRVCDEGCGAQSCAHVAGKTCVMTCLRGALLWDHPWFTAQVIYFGNNFFPVKTAFSSIFLGLYTVEELFSASCVVHSKVSHSHSSNTNFYEVLKNNGIQVLPPTGKYQVAM